MKREPAAIAALLAAVAAAVVEIIQAGQTGTGFDLWSALLVGLPLLAGIAVRAQVVPAGTIRDVIGRARSTSEVVTDLANRVDVAVVDRPRD